MSIYCIVSVNITTWLPWSIEVYLWFYLVAFFVSIVQFILHISALECVVFASSMNFDSLRTMFDNSGCKCFTGFSSNFMPFQYLFFILFGNLLFTYFLCRIFLCDVAEVLKAISDFTLSLNP